MKTLALILVVAFAGLSPLTVNASAEKAEKTGDASATAALKTCVVSGEELGSMGKPHEYVYKEAGKPDRTVLLCCKMCVGKFKKDPAKYLAQIDAEGAGKK